jgi:predicted metal-dependent hydrolase
MTRVLHIGELEIEVVRKDIKNIHLAVYPPNGRIRLAAPAGVNQETLRLFTISKLGWIKRQQRKFISQDRQSERTFQQRETHYFLGKKYMLRIVESDKPFQIRLRNKTFLDLRVGTGTSLKSKQTYLTEWYRKELKELIAELLPKWEKKIGVSTEDWGVRKMKTKWGTCNIPKKRIWFNLELATKPIRCIEYIVVHELVHLLERLHNEQFQAYMDQFLPQWRRYREELNNLPVSHIEWDY